MTHLDFPPEETINSWVLVAIIFGATLFACLLVFVSWCFYQKRKQGTSRARPFAPEDSVYDPILNGNTLQDIIEMTTSGSGSGLYLNETPPLPHIMLFFILSRSATVGAALYCTPNTVVPCNR